MKISEQAEEDQKKKPEYDELMKPKNTQDKVINLDVVGNFEDRNYEINLLFRSFSDLTKTLSAAKSSLDDGDDNQALLNYHEAAKIFDTLHNTDK